MATKKTNKTASTKVATTVSEMHEEFDKKQDTRTPPLRQGSKLLGKQKTGSARTIIAAPVLTNRPVNAYIERVINHADGKEGLWLWYTTEQSEMLHKTRLVEINHSTLQEIEQGFEWDLEYNKENAAEIAAESFGKTCFIFKDGESKLIISREQFLDYKLTKN